VTSPSRVHSSEPIAAIEAISDDAALLLSPPQSLSEARSTLVFPQAVTGGGYNSTLTLVNIEAFRADVTVRFASHSTTLQVPPSSAVTLNIASRLQLPLSTISVDAVRVSSLGSPQAKLLGILTLENSTSRTYVAAPAPTTESFLSHVVQGDGFFTG